MLYHAPVRNLKFGSVRLIKCNLSSQQRDFGRSIFGASRRKARLVRLVAGASSPRMMMDQQ